MTEAELKKLSVAQLGGRVGRLLNSSSKVNRFLAGDFKVPSVFDDLGKWFDKQTFGVSNSSDISILIAEAAKRDIKTEVKKAVAELETMQLTPAQQTKVPDAILSYEKYLLNLVTGMNNTAKYLSGTKKADASATKANSKSEGKAVTSKPKGEAKAKAEAKPTEEAVTV